MIILHGFPSSNYYNIVKHVLLHKEIEFTEDLIYNGGEEWRAISPLGKVPAITTEGGTHISESSVICDYLEEAYSSKPLYPADLASRAQVRQIMKVSELYLELPCRRLIAYAFSNKEAPKPVLTEVRQAVDRGVDAMQRLCKFSPWIAGEEMTMADIYVRYVCAVVGSIGSPQLEWDILAAIPGMKDWHVLMTDSDIARSVEADRVANFPHFQEYLKTAMGG